MASRKHTPKGNPQHEFGGDWTSTKLKILSEYLVAYNTALKHQPFRTSYIDAFAGTGYLSPRSVADGGVLTIPELQEAAPRALLDGSARIALKTEPRFANYVFIESNASRCQALETLVSEFPHLEADVEIRRGEANEQIQQLCSKGNWGARRAVLFLDPYGMQVDWKTIEAVAETKAIDMWLLFPLGIGVNRLLTRSGEIEPSWRNRLDRLLGTEAWYDAFYQVEHLPTLFDEPEKKVIKATTESIGRFFNNRLRTIFAGVAPEPRVLSNTSNCPLYLLCFAAANPKGAQIAVKIATHLLERVSLWRKVRQSSGQSRHGTLLQDVQRSAPAANIVMQNEWRRVCRRWDNQTTQMASL